VRDSYDYDVFLSYRRKPPVSEWVHNHFKLQLESWLAESAPFEPRIFVDTDQIDTGAEWPAKLRQALARSCIMVCVWSPSYFRSRWCLAEPRTMQERERLLNMRTDDNPEGLIFPLRYHDGEHFPPDVASIEYLDVSAVNHPALSFRDTAQFMSLIERVQELADGLSNALQRVPVRSDAWPVITPEPGPAPVVALPRL